MTLIDCLVNGHEIFLGDFYIPFEVEILENNEPSVKQKGYYDATGYYHLENSRLVPSKQNQQKKSSIKDIKHEVIDYEKSPHDMVDVKDYGGHEFENYYYSPENSKFYFDTGDNLRALPMYADRHSRFYVEAMDKENKQVEIYFSKFREILVDRLKQNEQNKLSNNGIEYEYIDYGKKPHDMVDVKDYRGHEFENYYYSPKTNKFYFDTGDNLRALPIYLDKLLNYLYVDAMDKENKEVKIYFIIYRKIL